jgi:hypothetical protein
VSGIDPKGKATGALVVFCPCRLTVGIDDASPWSTTRMRLTVRIGFSSRYRYSPRSAMDAIETASPAEGRPEPGNAHSMAGILPSIRMNEVNPVARVNDHCRRRWRSRGDFKKGMAFNSSNRTGFFAVRALIVG